MWPPLLSNNLYYETLIFTSIHSAFHINLTLYFATTCFMWHYFNVPLEGHIGEVLLKYSSTYFWFQELLTFPEHLNSPLVFNGVRVTWSFSFYRSSFVLLYFFFWLLCCLFFDLRILIIPLVFSLCTTDYITNIVPVRMSVFSSP